MNREEYLSTLHPLFRDADQALKQYVEIVRHSPGMTDASIEKQLIADGCERSMAQSIVLLVPLAFGRVIVNHFGVEAAETYIHHDMATDKQHEVELKTDIVFVWAKNVSGEYSGVTEFKQAFDNIVMRSAEVSAINNALNSGETGETLRGAKLAPSVVNFESPLQKP